MQYQRFPQQCGLRFNSSGMWRLHHEVKSYIEFQRAVLYLTVKMAKPRSFEKHSEIFVQKQSTNSQQNLILHYVILLHSSCIVRSLMCKEYPHYTFQIPINICYRMQKYKFFFFHNSNIVMAVAPVLLVLKLLHKVQTLSQIRDSGLI